MLRPIRLAWQVGMATSPICKTNPRNCFISVTVISFQVFKTLFLLKGWEEFLTFLAYVFDLVTTSFKIWSVTSKLKRNNEQGHQFSFLYSHWTGTPLKQDQQLTSCHLNYHCFYHLHLSYHLQGYYYLLYQNLDLLDFRHCTRWVIAWKATIIWCNNLGLVSLSRLH